MKNPAVNAFLASVSATAERFGVRALLRMWQRATNGAFVGKSL